MPETLTTRSATSSVKSSGSGFWTRETLPRPAALWTLAGCCAIAAAIPLDNAVANLVELPSSAPARSLAWWMSKLGEGWVILAAGLVVSLVCFLANRVNAAALTILVAGSGLLTGLAATIIRSFVGRARPHAEAAPGIYGIWTDGHWIFGQPQFASFPSGHAATVIGVAAALWLVNRKLGILAWIYALLVCWSRIASASHHFSDIVAAGILAVAGAIWLRRVFESRLLKGFGKLQSLRAPSPRPAGSTGRAVNARG